MTSYDVAFVDSIASSPTVRLDLNAGGSGWQCLADGTEFPPPELDRVVAQSQLVDGDVVSSAAYRNRTITLTLTLGTSLAADTAATQMQLLMRELDRAGNFLRVLLDTSTPVFFRTLRSGPTAVDWDPVMRRATVTLLAEPFALGLKETLAGVTVTNNPAAGANGMFLDIASPKGDVETPLSIAITNGTASLGVTGRLRSGLSIRRRGTVANTPFFLQAEAMTQGTDTTTQPNSASFSGSGNNYSRCTFGTPSGQQRLSANPWPSGSSTDYRGTYRVFLRCRQNTASDSIDVQLQYGTSAAIISNDIVRVPGDANIKYLDLGLVQFPAGFDPVTDGLSGVELAVQGTFLAVYVRRNSGAGTFDMDCLLFVPADDRVEFIKWPTLQAFSTDIFVAEGGGRPSAYCLDTTGYIRTTETIEIAGGGLMITPGRTNRVFFVRDLGTSVAAAGTSDSITATHVLTCSYYPRYLAPVRPVST